MSTVYDPKKYQIYCTDEDKYYEVWANRESEIECPTDSGHAFTIAKTITKSRIFKGDINSEEKETTISDLKYSVVVALLNAENPLIDDLINYDLTGNATGSNSNDVVSLTVNNTNDKSICQSNSYYNVVNTDVRRIMFDFKVSSVSNADIKIGLFDDHDDKTVDSKGDGIFLRCNNGSYSIVIRTSFYGTNQTDTEVAQADWNTDIADGTNDINNYKVDITGFTTLVIEQQGTKIGITNVGFVIDGSIVWVHRIIHTDGDSSILSRITLPVRAEITSSNNTSKTLSLYSMSIVSQKDLPNSIIFYRNVDTGYESVSKNSTETIVSIKLNNSYNRVNAFLSKLKIESSREILIEIYKGTTVSGSFTQNGILDINTNNNATGGTLISSFFINRKNIDQEIILSENKFNYLYKLASIVDGTPKIYSIKVSPTVNSNAAVYLSFEYFYY